jgi:hypothetical protein
MISRVPRQRGSRRDELISRVFDFVPFEKQYANSVSATMTANPKHQLEELPFQPLLLYMEFGRRENLFRIHKPADNLNLMSFEWLACWHVVMLSALVDITHASRENPKVWAIPLTHIKGHSGTKKPNYLRRTSLLTKTSPSQKLRWHETSQHSRGKEASKRAPQ